jgi:tol-pal system protein YbgF
MFDSRQDCDHDPFGLIAAREVSVSFNVSAMCRTCGRFVLLGMVAVLAISASGCGATQIAALEVEVQRQREDLSELRRNQAAQRVQFDEFRNRLVVLQDRLESEQIAAQRGAHARGAEPLPSLPHVVVQRAQEPAPQSAPDRGPIADRSAPRSVMIGADGVPHDVEGPTGDRDETSRSAKAAPARRGVPAAGPRADVGAPPPQDGNTAEEAAAADYRSAKGLLDAGRLDEARASFSRFLDAHPEHPLADNALYWIGETWYAKSLWLKAARVFGEVVSRFPKANKVPDAMLKTALCYQNLGETQLARDVLLQLQRLYPTTPAGEQARERLERMEEAR